MADADSNGARFPELKEKAGNLLDLFPVSVKSVRQADKPLFIEFSGTPKAGKTTAVDGLHLFLRRNGFRVTVLQERAAMCPLPNKHHMFFNIWTACSTLSQILEARQGDKQVVIIDRGLFDALCWMDWMNRTDRITDERFETIENFVTIDEWLDLIDLVFVMRVDAREALDREYEDQLTDETGTIMNMENISQFNDSLDNVYESKKEQFKKVVEMDTSGSEVQETLEEVAERTLESVDDLLEEMIMVIPRSAADDAGISPGFNSDPDSLEGFSEVVEDHGDFVDRRKAEVDNDSIQPIPIAYFEHDGRYLLFRRNEETPDNRLHEKYAIWAGGHVRSADEKGGDPIRQCLFREMKEELFFEDLTPEPEIVGLVYTPSDARSARHVGVVYRVELESDDVALSRDQKEFKETRGVSLSGRFVGTDQLKEKWDGMEEWTKILLADHLEVVDEDYNLGRNLQEYT